MAPETWAEWRWLQSPALTPSVHAADPRISVRDSYDGAIAGNNAANYAAIVAAQGADDNHTKFWWDVN